MSKSAALIPPLAQSPTLKLSPQSHWVQTGAAAPDGASACPGSGCRAGLHGAAALATGSISGAQPQFWVSIGPGLHSVSLPPALHSLPPAAPSTPCPSGCGLPILSCSTASVHCLRSASLSLDPSLCVSHPKTPRGSIGLAGQALGSGPCSQTRLPTAVLGQGSRSGLPSCGQSHG